ncbi:MAG: LPXTG cell wall anchor domain-containing protein [Nanoarchaeota archaeon]|nr:LPXTG cell wall anchor domain-containing protein [Nanoarchaeota archaeon]
MKNYTIILLLLLLVFSARALEIPSINISLMNQDPDPVKPGDYVELRFKVSNENGRTIAEGLELMLDPQYPFSLDPGADPLTVIGDLPGYGGSGKNIIVAKYKVRVDDSAKEGDNKIKLNFRVGKSEWISHEYVINVKTIEANLAIVSVETIPESIKPGDKAQIKIKVKNMADSTIRDVAMLLDLTFSTVRSQMSTVSATDTITAFNALPFAPVGSATEQKIDMLLPGEEKTFTYNLIAYSDAQSKVYKIPVQLTFYDNVMERQVKTDLVGVVVGTKPDLSVIIDETDLVVGKKAGTISIKFINKGFSDVKFLDVKMNDSDCFSVLSAHEVYIGNVDSDDYETAEFKLYCDTGLNAERSVQLPIFIQYRDSNNNLYEENIVLPLEIYDSSKMGEEKQNNLLPMLGVGAVLVVGFIIFRRRKK